MFENLSALPADPILGLISAFKNDTNPSKVDLGVGVYKDDFGQTPVMKAVKKSEEWLFSNQSTKAYIGPHGNPLFVEKMLELLLGESSSALTSGHVMGAQTPGGCGALRVAAELIKVSRPGASIWVSDPTWGNHIPLLGNAGINIKTYPYFDAQTNGLKEQAMFEALNSVPAGDIVLLHGCCHNPTGVDLSEEHWEKIAKMAARNGFVPFVDLAYQGFGESVERDAWGLRLLVESLPEVIIAASCSKNFGLYRDRTGIVAIKGQNRQVAEVALSHIASIVRGIYSMPPDHGAAVVAEILSNAESKALWLSELQEMKARIQGLRHEFSLQMAERLSSPRFDFVAQQKGMFSFLGLSAPQVSRLAEDYGIYMLGNSRASIAGLSKQNLPYVCQGIAEVCLSSD